MKNYSLSVRQFVNGKYVRGYVFAKGEILIGSTRKARVRIISNEIAGVVCLLQCLEGTWRVVDLGSQPDIKLGGKHFVETSVFEKTTLQVGKHSFELDVIEKRRPIFTDEVTTSKRSHSLTVVKWNGQVYKTGFDESFDEMKGLVGIQISHIPVHYEQPMGPNKIQVDPELKKPLKITAISYLLFLLIVLGLPMPKVEVKPKDNVYTRMIFDNKVLSQKRKALAIKASSSSTSEATNALEMAKATPNKATKAVSAMRKAGIQNLISKIAKRATMSAKMLANMAAMPQANASVEPAKLGGMTTMPSSGAITGKSGTIGSGKGFKVAGIGTGGKGGGTGTYKNGSGLGAGSVGNADVDVEEGDSDVQGGLDREVIAGVIREHLGQIRYCYERQLSANPELYGKIKVKFSIDSGGQVDAQSIGQSTLKSAMVEECILRRIASWKFPKPRGGTKVLVSYPFLFKSVN